MSVDFLFEYEDFFTGKVALSKRDKLLNKPISFALEDGYHEILIEIVNQIVKAARGGDFISSVDVLLIMAHFLENEWPLPKSLSQYIAETLNKTVISFGQASDASNRSTEVAKSLGLVVPRGSAKRGAALKKKMLIYSYMFWRMKIYGENLYSSAKKAVIAFNGTEGLSQDYCEKIYKELDGQKDKYPYNLFDYDVRYLFYCRLFSGYIHPVCFEDNEFLKEMIPYAKDDETRDRWLNLLARTHPLFANSKGDS